MNYVTFFVHYTTNQNFSSTIKKSGSISLEINNYYMVKKLTMWKGHRCSLQYHNLKKETNNKFLTNKLFLN